MIKTYCNTESCKGETIHRRYGELYICMVCNRNYVTTTDVQRSMNEGDGKINFPSQEDEARHRTHIGMLVGAK